MLQQRSLKKFLQSPKCELYPQFVALALLLLAFALLVNASAAAPVEVHEQQKEDIEQGIKKFKINIGRLQEGIKKQEEQIRQTKEVELTLLTELQDIDTRLVEQKHKIETLDARMKMQRGLVAEKKEAIDQAAALMQGVKAHIIKRMQSFYRLGELGLVNVTFSNRTLPELLSFQDSYRALIKHDQQAIETYRRTIAELEQAVESLKLQETIFAQLIAENKEEQEKIDALKVEKQSLLAKIQTQTKLHQQAVDEMEAAAQKLTSSLQGLEKQGKQLEQSFLYGRGKHPPPVNGTVIARFKEQTTNLLGISSISNGIAIDAPSGSTVRAIHDGIVQYSGYLRGYGNTVIVNHGNQYYSITSRMERLLVQKGQQVNENTEIGVMGDTATLLTPGLYFELRKDTDQLDPLEWLNTAKLK